MRYFPLDKECGWEKYEIFNSKKISSKNGFGKDFYRLVKNSFYGKTMKYVRNRKSEDFFEDDNEKVIKQQANLTFNAIQKS